MSKECVVGDFGASGSTEVEHFNIGAEITDLTKVSIAVAAQCASEHKGGGIRFQFC